MVMTQKRKQPPDLDGEFSDVGLIDKESDDEPTRVTPTKHCSTALAVVPSILDTFVRIFSVLGAF
ncbi:hypothetical protein V7S43_013690 [Phytophthora oleae]|uniref:Uncharacterized protein n=1 Tax=Phytophthora oleae TaxID=2107226 RepID=A0ABD3F675_9STRA